ncbi:hypothetical protein ACFVWR_07720 [Leifsonia sp. NPDC058292]|uniref:hypothetical protein n=1 Tax=Leifsonia sp. NPDC058292 TaxID=3346428 RepID=UPI0036DC38DE
MNQEPTFDPGRKDAIRLLVVTTARNNPSRQGRKRATLLVVLVLFALGISGGTVAYALGAGILIPAPVATETPTAPPVSTPTATPTPTPTPIPAATGSPVDPSDPSTWIIDFDGVGPVTLGSSFDAQRQLLPAFTDVTYSICSAAYLDLQAPNELSFLFIRPGDGSDVTAGIAIGSFEATRDSGPYTPRTMEGIGLGSTEQELKAAYPDIQQTGTYGDGAITVFYGITDGNGGWIVFRVIDGRVNDIQIANEAHIPNENRRVQTIPSERCPA